MSHPLRNLETGRNRRDDYAVIQLGSRHYELPTPLFVLPLLSTSHVIS